MHESENPLELILPLQDVAFVNTDIPGGLLVARPDAEFTILQANQGYFDLLGYTKTEVAERFENKGLRTLHPADVKDALDAFMTQVQQHADHTFCVKTRLLGARSDALWVSLSGRWDIDGQDGGQIYFLITDISAQQTALEHLRQEKAFNELVANLSEDAFFDCDILYGTIRLSGNFAKRFAIPETATYPQGFLDSGIVAQESRVLFEKGFFLDVEDEDILEEDLHMIAPNGEDVWYLCRYNVFHDSIGIPTRAVGKLTEMTKQKTQMDALSIQATRDPLTGLLNKRSTEDAIKDTLCRKDFSTDGGALMLVDVDNFKAVNDRLGHLHGDLVLAELADELRQIFGPDDVIGRIGGDEFFVFLQDDRGDDRLSVQAQEICRRFRRPFQENRETVWISASVGIALYPEHGEDFYSLYKNADTALYAAKQRGKNGFAFYRGEQSESNAFVHTEIESSGHIQKNFEQNAMEFLFRLLYESKDLPYSILTALQLIAQSYSFSRAYIFECTTDGAYMSNTYEWCAAGITPRKGRMQHVPMPDSWRTARPAQEARQMMWRTLDDVTDQDERNTLAAEHVCGMLQFGMREQGNVTGFIGFDDCLHPCALTANQLDALGGLCQVVETFWSKQRAAGCLK